MNLIKKIDYFCMNNLDVKFAFLSLVSYTVSKVTGFVSATASINLKDTWHFQALQELAFLAAIVSTIIAALSFHKNVIKKSKKKNE